MTINGAASRTLRPVEHVETIEGWCRVCEVRLIPGGSLRSTPATPPRQSINDVALIPNAYPLPIISSEWGEWQADMAEDVADGVIGPGIADAFWLSDIGG
jgi:hypothetical protein